MAKQKITLFGLIVLILALVLSGCSSLSGGSPSAEQAARSDDSFAGTTGGGYGGGEAFDAEAPEPAMEEAPSNAVPGSVSDGVQILPTMAPQQGGEGQTQPVERLIIRTGTITVSVDDTRAAQESIEDLVNSMAAQGAFVVSTSVYGGSSDGSPYINMQIRVPAERFGEVMDQVAALAAEGTIPSMSQSGQDVTEEYVDLAARLESLEAARDRLEEIMENAQTTDELLMAEAQLTQREAEIESIKGRMQYLAQSAALSSISIDLQPYILSQPVDSRWRPSETVRRAFEALLDSLRDLGDFLIYLVVFCGPYLLVIIPVVYLFIRWIRNQIRKRRERKAAVAASTQNNP